MGSVEYVSKTTEIDSEYLGPPDPFEKDLYFRSQSEFKFVYTIPAVD